MIKGEWYLDTTFPRLQRLVAEKTSVPVEMIDFLQRHESSLREVVLFDVELSLPFNDLSKGRSFLSYLKKKRVDPSCCLSVKVLKTEDSLDDIRVIAFSLNLHQRILGIQKLISRAGRVRRQDLEDSKELFFF